MNNDHKAEVAIAIAVCLFLFVMVWAVMFKTLKGNDSTTRILVEKCNVG